MFMNKLLIFTLLMSLISCEDKISETQKQAPQTTTNPATPDECDNSIDYSGIETVTDITDTTSKITWAIDDSSIGYVLFKSNANSLEVIKKFAANESSFNMTGLEAQPSHKFLVRTINSTGSLDCNENFQEFNTTEKNTFISCQEIYEYYQGVKPSGVYEIDLSLIHI